MSTRITQTNSRLHIRRHPALTVSLIHCFVLSTDYPHAALGKSPHTSTEGERGDEFPKIRSTDAPAQSTEVAVKLNSVDSNQQIIQNILYYRQTDTTNSAFRLLPQNLSTMHYENKARPPCNKWIITESKSVIRIDNSMFFFFLLNRSIQFSNSIIIQTLTMKFLNLDLWSHTAKLCIKISGRPRLVVKPQWKNKIM